MSRRWSLVELREVIELDIDKVPVEPDKAYQMVGVYSFGRGLFKKELIQGSETSYKHFYRLKAEHVVLSQLFGWEGAIAFSSHKFADMFVSPQFPTFICDSGSLYPRYLGWLIRRPSFWDDLATQTRGMGDRRRTLNPEALLSRVIPLPSMDEQRRIVAKIDKIAKKFHEAQKLNDRVTGELDQLFIAMAHRSDLKPDKKRNAGWEEVAIGEVVQHVQDPCVVDPTQSYPNFGIYSFGRGLFAKPAIDGMRTSAKTLYRVRAGQFIYSRLFAFEGAYGMVSQEYDGYFVSNEYPTFDCDTKKVLPELLFAYFKAPHIWAQLAEGSKGIGDRRQRVHPDRILVHKLMLPPLNWQKKIGSVIEGMPKLLEQRKAITTKLEALLPSVLEKAFKGEL